MSKLDEKQIEKTHKSAAGQEDKAFEEWVSQRVLDETAEMINGLENDPDLDDFEPSEELFQKIVGIAKERGLLAEDDETTDDEADEIVEKIELSDEKEQGKPGESGEFKEKNNESQRILRFSTRKRIVFKWVAMLAVTLLGVFGVSMSSQANRTFVIQKIDEIFGDDVKTKVNNSKDVIKSEAQEDEARLEIESALGIKLPILFQLPDEMVYFGYNIDQEAQTAFMEYKLRNESIYLLIFANYKSSSGIYENDQGTMIDKVKNELLGINAELWRIEEEGDKKPTFVVQWDYKNSFFEIMGKLNQDEIVDVFENILY